MANILGIHTGHTSTASLMRDGVILACVSEERLNRIKEWGGFPTKAIREVIEIANIKSEDVTHVAIASFLEPVLGADDRNTVWYRNAYRKLSPFFPKKYLQSTDGVKRLRRFTGRKRNNLERRLEKLGINAKIKYFDHHDCHAVTAYYYSGQEKSLIFTNDGGGDGYCGTIQIGNKGEIERVHEISQYNSIGRLYSSVTEYLGMTPLSHEYKVMGLAAYSKQEHVKKAYDALSKFFYFDTKDPLTFRNNSGVAPYNFLRKLDQTFQFERFDNIAGALQILTEEWITTWVKNGISQYGINKISLAGGVFMNVKVNQKLLELQEVEEIFIMPSCGDESTGIGASILMSRELGINIENLGPIYLGRNYDEEAYRLSILDLDKTKYDIDKREDIESLVGERLSEGKIIGRHKGAMEFGARALGNRSILTDPRSLSSVSRINETIKNRDFWMPFTPSVIYEDINKYIHNQKNHFAPYMITTFDTTELGRETIRAAIHQKDFTTRPQMLKKDWNDSYYNLLSSFKKETGVSACLNTSFNLHGYPIVESPQDALHVFENSDLDTLALGDYYITKK